MDMFGRHENKILGLLNVGPVKSKLVFMNEFGDKYVDYFKNYHLLNITKEDPCIVFGRKDDFENEIYEKFNEELNLITLFDETGKLKKDLFGTIKVKIIEIDKGFKQNTVFYGICEDDYGNDIIVKYGLMDKKKKSITIGTTIEISPLELVESDTNKKNAELIKRYGKNGSRNNGT